MMEQNNEKKKVKFSKKKILLIVLVLVVIAVAVILTLVFEKLEEQAGLRWDVTGNQIFSIGDETKSVLSGLDEDITIYTTYSTGNEDNSIEELLRKYKQENDHITVKNVDMIENPYFAQKYKEDEDIAEGSIIIQSDEDPEKYYVIDYSDLYEWEIDEDQLYVTGLNAEQKLTSTIALIERGYQNKAYFVTGHGEMNMDDIYYLTGTLESDGYIVDSYNLVYNEVALEPTDCLIFFSPTSDLSDEELKIMDEFLESGGKATFYVSPVAGALPNFEKIFAEYGIGMDDDLVIEMDPEHYLDSGVYLKPNLNPENETVQEILAEDAELVLPKARSITVKAVDGVESSVAATTTDKSYGKTNSQTDTLEKEEGDLDGPFELAVTAKNKQNGSRIFVMGCVDYVGTLDNAKYSGNLTFFVKTVSWAAEKTDTMAIPPKSLISAPLQINSSAASVRLMVLVVIIIPLIVIIYGIVVWRGRVKK